MYILENTYSTICNAIDGDLQDFIHNIVLVIKFGVPLILVFLGMLDFAKGVIASKEDEIKKGQQTLLKRAIAAVIVFFVIPLVQILINFVSGEDDTIMSCFNCFVNGKVTDKACKPVNDQGNGW